MIVLSAITIGKKKKKKLLLARPPKPMLDTQKFVDVSPPWFERHSVYAQFNIPRPKSIVEHQEATCVRLMV